MQIYFYNSFVRHKYEIKYYKVYLYTNIPKWAFDLKQYPQLLYKNTSVWAAIYKSSFIKQIKFIEKGYYRDFPFFIETVCKSKSHIYFTKIPHTLQNWIMTKFFDFKKQWKIIKNA